MLLCLSDVLAALCTYIEAQWFFFRAANNDSPFVRLREDAAHCFETIALIAAELAQCRYITNDCNTCIVLEGGL